MLGAAVKADSIASLVVDVRVQLLVTIFPKLSKDLIHGLSTGKFINSTPLMNKEGCKIPLIFNDLFISIFDTNGFLRSNINYEAVATLRQLLELCYKFEVPFTEEQELVAHQKFIDVDKSVKTESFPSSIFRARYEFQRLLPIGVGTVIPRHSNGKTNTKGIDNMSKRSTWRFNTKLYESYSAVFPHISLFSKSVMPTSSKLAVVPKDSRGPRSICMEPHERMYVQQGYMHVLYDHIENVSPAKGYINFTDQEINRKLAYTSSIDGAYATIDLKDASDMVSNTLLQKLCSGSEWDEIFQSTRSSTTSTLHGTIELKKFAPMGSALCFPVEAMVFYAIARTVTDEVYVYGDDIIVPTCSAREVMSALEGYGLVVNRDKSFMHGSFRESCGAYYHNGHDISIVQCKSLEPLSLIQFVNDMYARYNNELLHENLTDWLESYLGYILPRSDKSCCPPGFIRGKVYLNDVFFRQRFNKDLQYKEIRVLQPGTVPIESDVSDDLLYHDALVSMTPYLSLEERDFCRVVNSFLNKRYNGFGAIQFRMASTFVKTKKKLKFTWVSPYAYKA